MKRVGLLLSVFLLSISVYAENYLINGGQSSRIQYELKQHVEPADQTKRLKMRFVVPESFSSPTYKQTIENFSFELAPKPSKRQEERDERGNRVIKAEWKDPKSPVQAVMRFTAINETVLQPLSSNVPFPLKTVPKDLTDYLKHSSSVQSDNAGIQKKAKELVQGVETQFDAVQRILTWVVDNMRYVSPPVKYDALYSFESGRGNCQNYSHLAAALMRVVGIPVRIVNGVTLKEPYTVKTGDGEFTFKFGQGRHSWIEIYFEDLGWIPFDPQQSELFVSNRFVRIEVGVDNEETINDGMVRWNMAKGVSGRPQFQEMIEAEFVIDDVQLTLTKQNYGPKKMLLCPEVTTAFTREVVPPPPPVQKIDKDEIIKLKYETPFLFGNLDYPKGIDFIFSRGPAIQGAEDEFEMRKNFMVETAEYVTTKMTQYVQVVVLSKPVKLVKIGLALHKFGGSGQLWIDLMKDNDGKPGDVIATSEIKGLNQIPLQVGYNWADFDFSNEELLLTPGNYWIGLGFTGSPIMNWFYTYGKSVGPIDGTRYKGVFDANWSGALAYEFNYRVAGWTIK